jgi:hypothetical protein
VHLSWELWLMPIILATQEADIRRIVVQSQPEQIVHETLSWKTLHKKGMVKWLKVWVLSSNMSSEKKSMFMFHYKILFNESQWTINICILLSLSNTPMYQRKNMSIILYGLCVYLYKVAVLKCFQKIRDSFIHQSQNII